MANLTYDRVVGEFAQRTGDWARTPVANGVQLYGGSLVGVNAAGFAVPWADTAGNTLGGIAKQPVLGNTGITPNPTVQLDDSGGHLEAIPVATATAASMHALVYCATDNPYEDATLVASSNVGAIGMVMRVVSAGVCDVRLFTPTEHVCLN